MIITARSVASRISPLAAARALCIVCCWSASFDIFLNIDIGVNIRLCQLLLSLAFLLAMPAIANEFRAGTLSAAPGFIAVLGWLLIVVVMSASASNIGRGPGYALWTLLCVGSCWLISELFNTPHRVRRLIELYFSGFIFVALFGVAQFVLPLVHIAPPLVAQWWIADLLPRVNGFSYEPSYYATYLLLGYIPASFVASTTKSEDPKLGRLMSWVKWLTLLAIILSSSRMGLLFIAIWEAPRVAYWAAKKLYLKSVRGLAAVSCLLLGGAVLGGYVIFKYSEQLAAASFLLNGLGIAGEASHSVDERSSGFWDTVAVFLEAPLFGVGLGSVAEHIAALRGHFPKTYLELKDFEGLSVFAELLAGTGIVGFVLFVMFLARTFFGAYRRSTYLGAATWTTMGQGLVWGAIIEMGILQLNQNILRPYVWFHLGLLAAIARLGHHGSVVKG